MGAKRSGTQWTYEERKAQGKRMVSLYLDEADVEELDALVTEDGSSRNVVVRELVSAERKRRARKPSKA